MKHIFIILFAVMFSTIATAQLKTIPANNNTEVSETIIDVPNFKKTTASKTVTGKNFRPRTLNYSPSEQNGLKVMNRADNNLPILITGNPQLSLRNIDTPEEKAMNFLDNAKDLMLISNPIEEFKILKKDTDELGITHMKFQQMHMNVPIYGAEIIYHFNNKSQWLNGRYKKTPTLESVTPSIDIAKIKQLTINNAGKIKDIDNDQFNLFDFEKIKGELVIYEGQLCYEMTVYKSIIDRWEYIMDAHSGEVIRKHQNICKFHNHGDHSSCSHDANNEQKLKRNTISSKVNEMLPPPDGPTISNAQDLFGSTRQINTYESGNQFYLIDAARTMYDNTNSNIPNDPVGTIWTIDAFNTNPQNSNFKYDHVVSNSSNFSGKQTGVSAQYNGGQAYQYFKVIHDRESINGAGGNVIGLINIADEDGSSLGNAFWNGIAMFYGNGDNAFNSLARGLDVAGHEMSHGVIQSTANLEYQGESGALNESFADIFGAMIDRDDWEIGEDVVKTSAFPSGALRSLQDPHNGASSGNFNAGWQPRTYSERFTGSQDNGGVHINSGIVNWAFYKFATSAGVGKDKAEKVYYRALDKYLTKSSQFIDARLSVVQAANDLYGASVANSARAAFDAVEIFNGDGTVVTTDVETNPGEDFIIFTENIVTSDGEESNDLYITKPNGDLIVDSQNNSVFFPLTEENPRNPPSISDDGTSITFVNEEGKVRLIEIDWNTLTVSGNFVLDNGLDYYRSVISKDGNRLGLLTNSLDNLIIVYDRLSNEFKEFSLYNPTSIDSIVTNNVVSADALEFSLSGEFIIYDANNEIESQNAGQINYWDIGFINVWNNDAGTFGDGDVSKLYTNIPKDLSLWNPTFSKNSDFIISYEEIYPYDATEGFGENDEITSSIVNLNIETGERDTVFAQTVTGDIFQNNPNFSRTDDRIIFNGRAGSDNARVVGAQMLKENKLEPLDESAFIQFPTTNTPWTGEVKWGVWFGNGDREITATEDVLLEENAITLFPNPAGESITIKSTIENAGETQISIVDIMGRSVMVKTVNKLEKETMLDISVLTAGSYILNIKNDQGISSEMFIKE